MPELPEVHGPGISAIYVASPEGDTGKSTIALGILHRLAATVAKVGVFRPITRLGETRDYILELLLAHTTAGLPYEDCVGVSYLQLHEDPDAAIADIVDRYHRVADQCDAVLIVGSDYTDVATPERAERQRPHRGQPRRAGRARGEGEEPRARRGRPRGRTVPGRAGRPARAHRGGGGQPVRPGAAGGGRRGAEEVRAEIVCAARGAAAGAPSVADLQRAVDGTVLRGDPALLSREVMGVLVAGMTAEHVLERLTEGVAVSPRVTAPTSCWRS